MRVPLASERRLVGASPALYGASSVVVSLSISSTGMTVDRVHWHSRVMVWTALPFHATDHVVGVGFKVKLGVR